MYYVCIIQTQTRDTYQARTAFKAHARYEIGFLTISSCGCDTAARRIIQVFTAGSGRIWAAHAAAKALLIASIHKDDVRLHFAVSLLVLLRCRSASPREQDNRHRVGRGLGET